MDENICFVIEERDRLKLEKNIQQAILEIEKKGLKAKIKYQAELDQKSDAIIWYYSVLVYGVERKTSL